MLQNLQILASSFRQVLKNSTIYKWLRSAQFWIFLRIYSVMDVIEIKDINSEQKYLHR